VARIVIPPLRDRKEDIPLLLDHFVREANLKLGKDIKGATERVIKRLKKYDWPGNVRELENTITNLCINTHGDIIRASAMPEHYTPTGIRETESETEEELLDRLVTLYLANREGQENLLPPLAAQLERKLIEQVRERTGGNKSRMAALLGISRVTLAKKLPSE
jgi:two-component system nitrogen regulation response regulator GlnG